MACLSMSTESGTQNIGRRSLVRRPGPVGPPSRPGKAWHLPLIVAEGANPIGCTLPLYCSIGLGVMTDSSNELLERSTSSRKREVT